jgi:hypothetical protein
MEIRKLGFPFVCDMNQAVTENRRPWSQLFQGVWFGEIVSIFYQRFISTHM